MGTYYLENFGCRATQADGAAIERDFHENGIARAASAREAEVAVLNSCTVTASADADVRATVRRIHRENPACKILVTGCYAQRAPEELAALPGVAWVVGNSHKKSVAGIAAEGMSRTAQSQALPLKFDTREGEHFHRAQRTDGLISPSELGGNPVTHTGSPLQLVGDIFAHTELMAAPVFESGMNAWKTRPNLKVQDGCDNRCSFCIIPFVRGQSRSLPMEDVLRECDALVAAGYREIVISGINLGRWGRDFAQPQHFESLMRTLLERTSIERIRISSVEPMDWSDELIAMLGGEERICKHAHVPLQSGSDRVLRKMHRKYRPWHYAEKLAKIRAAASEAAIGADVMVGFPGETEEMFAESEQFIRENPFTYLHVFTFSARPGTPAATMPEQVPLNIARARNRRLRELIAEKNKTFRASFVGKTVEAITLHRREDGHTEALTNNFIKLHLAGDHAPNQLLRVQIEGLNDYGLSGCTALAELIHA